MGHLDEYYKNEILADISIQIIALFNVKFH